ncbi:hypothetical protein HLRTI_003123 [Halorhabdus tiamatea SARL4B]|uniref:Uncharacterized protein n=1 Tax=Halorhabdus tiamatea SARL4B TaxID=1033806 RepID=U2DFP8_9EURY|nr:hypothetical protein HLRTI_003123 [Halorhabdus tiamatea SARL4B]
MQNLLSCIDICCCRVFFYLFDRPKIEFTRMSQSLRCKPETVFGYDHVTVED